MILTFLGTSAANAYPEAFCRCDHCKRARALGGRNLRKRSALLVNDDLLIDLCLEQMEEQVDAMDLAAGSGFYWLPFDKLELQFYNESTLQFSASAAANERALWIDGKMEVNDAIQPTRDRPNPTALLVPHVRGRAN